MRRIIIAAVLAAAALTGCNHHSGSAFDADRCADLMSDPHWAVTLKQDEGCTSANGELNLYAVIDCADRIHLYQFSDGKTHYWGLSNGPLHRTDKPGIDDPLRACR
jgi:hypothetical protein